MMRRRGSIASTCLALRRDCCCSALLHPFAVANGQFNVISMSAAGTPSIIRRTASFNSASSPHSPVSPFTRSLSANSASSFGCSDFPSCIHWCDQLEPNEVSYEMLHFHDDMDHVNGHFHGDVHEMSCDEDDDSNEQPVRLDSLGSWDGKYSSDAILASRSSSDVLVRRASAPSSLGSLASESRLSRLIRAFELNSLKYPNPNRSIHVILRGIELKQSAWERLSKSFLNYDIGVLDIAPKVKFDSDSKSYVHCRPGDCDPNTGNDGMRSLLQMLQSGPDKGKKLLQLIIPRCNIGKRGVAALAHSLSAFENLRVLEIRENPGVGVHFSVLAQSLQHCSNLKVLNIAACGLGMHGSYVLEAILPRLFQIEDLYLTNNYITGTIMERLAPALEKLTCLRKLFLQQNDLGKKGAEALKNSFPNMTSITLLTLDYCVLRAEGLLDISHGLRHLTLLQTLRINHNGLGLIKVKEAQEVCTVLSRSLSQMKHLKKVELAQSGFGPEDALILAQALLEANPNVDVDDKKVKEVLKFLQKKDRLHAELAAKRLDFDDEESQPMRCMLSEVYSHNIVRHQPINKNQCGGCQSPRVSIVANFFKGKQGVETRRASFIGEKGSYNEHVVMKTVPYPRVGEKEERKRLDKELNDLSRVSRDSPLFLEVLSISFHYEECLQSERHVPQPSRKCFLSAIVPFCGGGTLCERLWKGLSPCAGDHMQIVDALSVTDLTQKYHLAIGIAKALRHCHDLDIVHSDLCCCNILLTPNKQSDCDVLWSVKVANTGVCPDSDSLIKRCVYLAPELRAAIPVFCESGAQSPQYHSSPFTHSSSPSSSHSPPLPSMRSPAGALPHDRIPFTKESDVYALGVTLMQLFRHTLADCAQDICKFCAEKSSCGLNVPCFPRETSSSLFPPLPVLLQTVISSCTRRDPKARPSASKISEILDTLCDQRASSQSEREFEWLLLQ